MPKLIHKRPVYNHHQASNRARVCINGRYRYLPGTYDSPESRRAYYDLLMRWERGEDVNGAVQPGASPPEPGTRVVVAPQKLLIAELLERYERHALIYYRRDGKSTAEPAILRCALRPLLELCGDIFAAEFKPSDLRRIREDMIHRGWSRRYINRSVGRVKRFFNWAVEFEHVGAEVGALVKFKGLEQYRSEAKEKDDIESVPDELVEATLPHFVRSEAAADMVQIQRKCGARPGEMIAMQVEEIDRRDPECWWFRPRFHKTMHKGKKREIPIGKEAQAILLPYIGAAGTGKVFHYSHRDGYRLAIWRACDRAFPHPTLSAIPSRQLTPAQRADLTAWQKAHRWCPLQLRHTCLEDIRDRYGLDAAQAVAGHACASTSEIYAKVRAEKGREVMRAIG